MSAVPPVDLITALRKRNPAHDGPLGAQHWQLVDDAVTGQGGFLAGLRDLRVHDYGPGGVVGGTLLLRVGDGETYLQQFPRETSDDFTARVRASTYDNHVAPVLRSYTGQLWSDAPVRDTSIEAVRRFWDDPDAGLGKVDAWVAQGSDAALRHGWAMALIDRPEGDRPATDPGTTARWLDPREVADWQIDARGEVVALKLRSETHERDLLTGEEIERETYTLWTRAAWRRITLVEKGEKYELETDTGDVPHALGRVPVAVLRWVPSMAPSELCAPSVLSGSVAAAVELFNVQSEQRQGERDTAFSILCVQTDDTARVEGTKLGTQSGMTYPLGAAPPSFIAPDPSVLIHYGSRVDALTTRIYEAAYQERPSAQAIAPESGVSRGYRFRQMSALLVVAASQHEAFEREVVAILAAWDGADASAWQAATTITYPRRFDPLDAETRADRAMAVIEKGDQLVPELVALARADIGRALYPRLAPDAEARLRAQLEARAERERAAYETTAAVQTIDAATTAAVNDLPAPAPGEFVPSLAGPTAADTTAAGA
jgi:hypothetical protein